MLKQATLCHRGMTIIELLITLTILAIALSLAIPAYSNWIQNTQIRTAAETALAGIQAARAEGLRRNDTVHFQLVTSTDASCARSATGSNWVVSTDDAAGKCNVTDPGASPFITRIKSGKEATNNVTLSGSQSSIDFNGLGQASPAGGITIDIKNPTGGTCTVDGGKMRCLRLQVSSGGQARMCDPSVTATSDPRSC